MATQKQIDANRKNSKNSTGPRTSRGKATSSLNAIKPKGLEQLLTPDEDDSELKRILGDYLSHYRPETALEKSDVKQLAFLDWRLRRHGRIEPEILSAHGFLREPGPGEQQFSFEGCGWALSHDCMKSKSLLALSVMEDRLFRMYCKLRKQLNAILPRAVPGGTPGNSKIGESPVHDDKIINVDFSKNP